MSDILSPDRSRLVTHIVGARPNFPKAAPVIAALDKLGALQRLVHTGQHYDDALSGSFFRDLGLREPDVNLSVGSSTHAQQTAGLLSALEVEFLQHLPHLVVVYGDINSTLAATLCASKLQLPTAHIEAGLRSFDRAMPEEINRIVTDQLAELLFTTSPEARVNLLKEGVADERIFFVGNPMIDTLLKHAGELYPESVRMSLKLPARYVVATLHRPGNVDDPADAEALVHALVSAANLIDIVIPLHPRGREALGALGLAESSKVHVTDPLNYLDFISLVSGARAVITDSGGVQEETTMMGIPCLTLRPNTERPITITHGTNRLVKRESLVSSLGDALAAQGGGIGSLPAPSRVPPLWDGRAGERIAGVIDDWMQRR